MRVLDHHFEPLFYNTNECHDCGQSLDRHGRMTGRVFPRTPQGLDKAMQWAGQQKCTVTLIGSSTFTVGRTA